MVTVIYKQVGERLTYLKVSGHANSGPHGADLVCSAVSAITVGGLNNLSEPKAYQLSVSEGLVEVLEVALASPHDQIVLETILTGLQSVQASYPQFLKITRKD